MILQILALFAFVSLSETKTRNEVAFEISWSRYKDARSVTVNETSYSVTDKFFLERGGWEGVSVLGLDLASYGRSHTAFYNIYHDLNDERGMGLIKKAYRRANGDDTCGPGAKLGEPERYVFDGDILKSSLGGGENFVTYDSSGYSVFMLDENNYSVSGPSLPDELERVFVDEDMLTIVEKDGNTMMRPTSALQERIDYEDLLEEIRRAIKPVESSRRLLAYLKRLLMEMEATLIHKARVEFEQLISSYVHNTEDLEAKIYEFSSNQRPSTELAILD